MAGDFFGLDFGGAIVGYRGGHDEGIVGLKFAEDGLVHLGGSFNVDAADALRHGDGDGAEDEGDVVADARGGGGEGGAHAAGAAVGDVADGVDGLARGAGGEEEAEGGHFGKGIVGWGVGGVNSQERE
jgi:hypothetical protein